MASEEIIALLEKNTDLITEATMKRAAEGFTRYRHASEMELAHVGQMVRGQLLLVQQVLGGMQMDDARLGETMRELVERLARQGFPLHELLGIFHLLKETCFRFLHEQTGQISPPAATDLLLFVLKADSVFHRFELGLVGPYLQFQENIIQTQEAFLKHKISSLFRLVEAISNNLNIREFCEILLEYVCKFYDVKVSGVFLLDEKEKELYPQHVTGLSRRFIDEHRYVITDPPVKKCLQDGAAFYINDEPYPADQYTVPLPETETNGGQGKNKSKSAKRPACTSVYAPMVGRQKTYGMVSIHSLRPRRYSQNEIQQFETLARIMAVALENARFYQNLLAEKGKLDAIVNSISDGLVLVDFHEEIVYINNQAARYFQQPVYRLLGANASILPERLLANAKDPHVIQSAYMRALASIMDHPVLECTLYRPEMVDLRLAMFPVRDREHHFIGRGLIIEDITHEKEIDRMKSEFVAMTSHTMRTPMTSILGFASLLLEKKMTAEEQKKYIQFIHRESQHLTNILNDMLDLMNIEAGKIALKILPVEALDLVKAAIQEARVSTPRKVEVEGGEKRKIPRLLADKQKMIQALEKVIQNAIRHTTGKIRISVKKVNEVKYRGGYYHSNVQIHGPGLFPAVAFSVEDSGPGIPYDQLDAVFEPFHRVPSEKNRDQEGSGLGLTISKYIVEAHGGRIWVETKPGKGSVFTILMPVELASTEKIHGPLPA
ncbi:GAF domain-containing protein [candidate division FCPU426 bacterium]|nr:GAF domain-containing protein [candidate division FCPU426 bacterium]